MKKSFLKAAPQAFLWGQDKTWMKNKAKKKLLLHNLKPRRDKLWEFCKQQGIADS